MEKTNLKDGEEVRVIVIKRNLSRYRGIVGKASYEELRKLEEEAQLKILMRLFQETLIYSYYG